MMSLLPIPSILENPNPSEIKEKIVIVTVDLPHKHYLHLFSVT